jgi:hypothetical protein
MKNFQNKKKIIKVSRQMCGLLRITLGVWIIGMALFLFVIIAALTHGGNVRAFYLTGTGIVEMLLAIVITLNFLRFFSRLAKGELFDAVTVRHLNHAGIWWFLYWLVDSAICLVGKTQLGTTMNFSFGQLFAALTVIFVAWLLKEAQDLKEEQALTV